MYPIALPPNAHACSSLAIYNKQNILKLCQDFINQFIQYYEEKLHYILGKMSKIENLLPSSLTRRQLIFWKYRKQISNNCYFNLLFSTNVEIIQEKNMYSFPFIASEIYWVLHSQLLPQTGHNSKKKNQPISQPINQLTNQSIN